MIYILRWDLFNESLHVTLLKHKLILLVFTIKKLRIFLRSLVNVGIDDYVDIMIQEVSKVLVFSDTYSPTVGLLQVIYIYALQEPYSQCNLHK